MVQDEAWAVSATATDIATPSAGNYKLAFDYMQGLDLAPLKNLQVKLLQGGIEKVTIAIDATAVTSWTHLETETVALAGEPVTVAVLASNGTGTAGQLNYAAAFDTFQLIEEVAVPLELDVFPTDNIYLSGTESIVATPSFGSGTYTQVEFDVNADGTTIEFTDTTAPFEFSWNTLADVAAGTSRTLDVDLANTPIDVRVTVTDSNNDIKSVDLAYTVDNRYDGRESLITNGDFSQWQETRPSTTPGNPDITMPVGWEENWTSSTQPEIGPAPGRDAAAGDALRIKFGVSTDSSLTGFPDRYTIRTIGKTGNYHDLQTYFWGKGSFARLYYMTSEDGGATFAMSIEAASADGTAWTFALDLDPTNIGLSDTSQVALGTHQLLTTEHLWDDIVSTGIKYPENADVGEWKLY